MLREVHPVFVVQVQGNLAVGLGTEPIAFAAQVVANGLETIEFAVDHQLEVAALVSDRLIAVVETDNAQPDMA